MNINNIDKLFNHYKRLLADKHNAKSNKLNKVVMMALLKDKRTRLNTAVKDYFVFYDSKEYLRRFYLKKESKVRIPKFAVYYKDYLKYFCKAMIKDLSVNKVLMRNMEKVAQDFYYNNYQKGNNGCNGGKKEVKRNSPMYYGGGSKSSNKFFDKRVVNEIEKGKYIGDNDDDNNNNNLLKKSISNQNISAISRILPLTDKQGSNNNNIDNQSNDSLMESILLSLETKKQKDITPKTKITNSTKKPTNIINDNNNNNNIKHHKSSFPSSLIKTKSSLKISNNITSIHPSKDTLPINLYHSTQFKHPSNLTNKLKLHPHSNNNNNNNTTTTTNTKSFNNQQLHHHPSTQVVYQYQKYRFNSSDKTPIPPNIIPSTNTMTISSPKHSIHLLSVSPSNSHHKIWSPHSNNANKTSYQRFMLQNKSGQLNRMITSSTITNTLIHGSPTGIKIKSNTKISFNNNSKQTFTRMKSFSLRNSIGIEDNLNGVSGVVLPNNYRKGNKGGYLYGSVTSLYKRDFKTMVKGENVKTNRHDASKTYNNTLRMNYNGSRKYSN